MINFGTLIGVLLALIFLGIAAVDLVKNAEVETAKAAVEAHRTGYISIEGFQRRLERGK